MLRLYFFFFEKNYMCHPNLLKSVQNSNMWKHKVTRNSSFKIPWNEPKLPCLLRDRIPQGHCSENYTDKTDMNYRGKHMCGEKRNLLCVTKHKKWQKIKTSNKKLFPNLLCMHRAYSLMQSYMLQLFNIFLQRFC